MLKSLQTIALAISFISLIIAQSPIDSLPGDLLQMGEIIFSSVDPSEIVSKQLDYIFERNITQDYTILLTLKNVTFQKECNSSYEFKMNTIQRSVNGFILEISKFQCLDRVDIQWFAHTYQDAKPSLVTYFKEQKYEKNVMIGQNKTLNQTYIFDSKEDNRKVISLFTGFSVPSNIIIDQKTLYQQSQYHGWRNAISQDVQFNFTNLNTIENRKPMSASFVISFIITHPSIFECDEEENKKLQSNIMIENIKMIDTTLLNADTPIPHQCSFRQYTPNPNLEVQASSQMVFINSNKYFQNGSLVDEKQIDTEKNKEVEEEQIKEEVDEKGLENNENNENNEKNENNENENNERESMQAFQIIMSLVFVIGVLAFGIIKYYKVYRYEQVQNMSAGFPNHIQMQDNL